MLSYEDLIFASHVIEGAEGRTIDAIGRSDGADAARQFLINHLQRLTALRGRLLDEADRALEPPRRRKGRKP